MSAVPRVSDSARLEPASRPVTACPARQAHEAPRQAPAAGRRRDHRPPRPRPRLGRGPRRRAASQAVRQLPARRRAAATRTWGRCCSSRPASRSSTLPGDAALRAPRGRRPDRAARRRGAARAASVIAAGERAQEPGRACRAETDERRRGDRRGARGVRAQHGRAHARGARAARRQDRAAALRHRLPRPPGADRRARRRPQARPAGRCGPTSATCGRCSSAVDGGADALLEEGFSPDMIVGDMDSAAEATLRCGAELVVHAYPDGRAPGRDAPRAARARRTRSSPRPGTSQDVAMLIAAEKGARADRLGRLAVQPRRVPRQEPPRDVLDVPHAPARRRDPRRRQGREPPLPPAARARRRSRCVVAAGLIALIAVDRC